MTTFRFGDFEWDDAKARANVRKHGISFAEAASCFLDPAAFTAPDTVHPGRFILIGLSQQLRVLFVVSAEIGERIRIITARKATPAQRKVYENGPQERNRSFPLRSEPRVSRQVPRESTPVVRNDRRRQKGRRCARRPRGPGGHSRGARKIRDSSEEEATRSLRLERSGHSSCRMLSVKRRSLGTRSRHPSHPRVRRAAAARRIREGSRTRRRLPPEDARGWASPARADDAGGVEAGAGVASGSDLVDRPHLSGVDKLMGVAYALAYA